MRRKKIGDNEYFHVPAGTIGSARGIEKLILQPETGQELHRGTPSRHRAHGGGREMTNDRGTNDKAVGEREWPVLQACLGVFWRVYGGFVSIFGVGE